MSDSARRLPLFGASGATAPSLSETEPTEPLDLPEASATDPGASDRLPTAPAVYGRLVRAAWPLLCVVGRLRTGAVAADPNALKLACVTRVRQFESDAAVAGIAPPTVRSASYALCTALDEAVLATEWGDQSDWAQDSLLATFHGETWGGEKVFVIVDRVLADTGREIELAELIYLLLSFGFQGRYHLRRNGGAEIENLRDRLARTLRRKRDTSAALPRIIPRTVKRRVLPGRVAVWVMGVICVVGALAVELAYRHELIATDAEVAAQYREIASPP